MTPGPRWTRTRPTSCGVAAVMRDNTGNWLSWSSPSRSTAALVG